VLGDYFSHTLLILGAIGGNAYLIGFFLRLFTGEDAEDSTVYTWRWMMFGGTGLLSILAVLLYLIEPDMSFLGPIEKNILLFLYMPYLFVTLFMYFFGFLWRIWKSGDMVSEWTYHTLGFLLGVGLVLLVASFFTTSIFIKHI
jgi:hypothetical protein